MNCSDASAFSFFDQNLELKRASNLLISTPDKSMERVGLETTTSSSNSREEVASGPIAVHQVAGDSAHMEVAD